MQRYFGKILGNKVNLTDEDIHHITRVMRMKKGDQFEVVSDNELYVCQVNEFNPLNIEIVNKVNSDTEIKEDVYLFFPLAKGDKIDFVIQKATELGVKKIILFKSQRCVVNFSNDDFNKKVVRYNRIAKEASEQCHRLIIPEILGVVDVANIPNEYKCDINLFAYEKKAGDIGDAFLDLKNKSISYIVGPEGGFTPEEAIKLEKDGFIPVSLGKRILRCETAAVYGLSVIGYNLEK